MHSSPRPASYFALLLTDHAPSADLQLVAAAEEAMDLRLRCELLSPAEEQGLVLLAATPAHMLPFRTPRILKVQRGRRGSKPAEQLLLLQAIPPTVLAQNNVQRQGLYRAILRALRSIRPTGAPSRFDGWLAVELATTGYVSRAAALKASKECDAQAPEPGGDLIRADQLLLWKDYLDRETARMLLLLQKQLAQNPLLDRVDLLHIASALRMPLRPICVRVSIALAQRLEAREERSLLGQYVVLGSKELKRREISPDEAALVQKILSDYEGSEGTRLDKLKAQHQSHLHVIDWMLKAHLLYETPTGYVLTRGQMDKAFAAFRVSIGQPGAPGVGDIKQRLGWGRSLAEALRELLSREDLLEFAATGARPVRERGRG